MIFSMIDSETRKRLGLECEQLLLQMEYVLDSINEGVLISDLEGNIVAMNQVALALHEFDENQQVRQHLSRYRELFDLTDFAGEPVPFEKWPFRRVYLGERFENYEVQVRRKGSSRQWVGSYSGAPVQNNAGEVILCVLSVREITDRKDLEAALRQTNETLEERIKEAVQELRQKDQLLLIQGRQAVMGETISNIAHQWRQPLNTLALLAQELLMTCRAGCGQKYLEANIEKSLETIRHLSATIDDFRYFLKPCAGKEEFKAVEVLEKTLSLLEGSLAALQITTAIETVGDPVVSGCPSQFSQVLLNLLNNARDAFARREVSAPLVVIRVYSEGGSTVVTVADNAGGIPEQVIGKVFEPYFTTKDSLQGRGLGLFICKTILEKSMDGTISVRNLNAGTEFRIELAKHAA